MKIRYLIIICIVCLFAPLQAIAIDIGESVQVHGYLSQGYLHSSNNNFLANSRDGSAEFTDLALNANWGVNDYLRVGGQIFYRNLGDYAEDKVVLDWAVLDFQPLDWLGVRLGKVKMPLGLYNENRDSDFLQPTIFLPQSIYDESRRDTYLAYIGGGIYGNVSAGFWGDVDYHLFVGEASYPEDSILSKSTDDSIKKSLKNIDLISSERKSEELYGGALVLNSSVPGLRLGFSLLQAKNNVYVNGAATPLIESTVRSKFVASLEYSWRNWVFVSEYGETDRQTKSAGVVNLDGPSQSWYVMASYSPFERWTFTALYDEFYRLKHDKDGNTKPTSDPFMGWRKDIGVAVRYDLSDNWTMKGEYHNVDGGSMQLGVINADVDRYWNYFAAKLTYSF